MINPSTPALTDSAIARIRTAFASIPYPGDNEIGDRHPGTITYTSIESGDVERFFMGRRWQDITLETLGDYEGDKSACLAFMTPNARRYYLPAYMILSLQDFTAADMSARRTVDHLIPSGPDSEDNNFNLNFAPLTRAQREAVASFLQAILNAHGRCFPPDRSPARALSEYWSRYRPTA